MKNENVKAFKEDKSLVHSLSTSNNFVQINVEINEDVSRTIPEQKLREIIVTSQEANFKNILDYIRTEKQTLDEKLNEEYPIYELKNNI